VAAAAAAITIVGAIFAGIPMNKQGKSRDKRPEPQRAVAHYACARARVNDGGGSADDGDDAKRDDNNNDDVDVVGNETDTRLPACLPACPPACLLACSRPPLRKGRVFPGRRGLSTKLAREACIHDASARVE